MVDGAWRSGDTGGFDCAREPLRIHQGLNVLSNNEFGGNSMSRLFEALSGLKTEHRATQVVAPDAVAPPAVVPPPPKQEAKPEHHSLKLVHPTVGPLALVPADPAQEAGEENKAAPKPAEPVEPPAVLVSPSPEAHLVAL